MIKKLEKFISFVLVLLVAFLLVGCQDSDETKDKEKENNEDKPKVENVVTHETYNIMVGTTLETEVHVYTSSIEGPTIFIMGGTHGDEVAGWKAAEKLLTPEYYETFIGKVIVIPYADKLGVQLQQRYPGVSSSGLYDGIKYSDLNRAFPGNENGTLTEQLAYALCAEVRKYSPRFVVDLHESRGSYTTEDTGKYKLGNQLLYANGKSALLCDEILEIYNSQYLEDGDTRFNQEGPGVEGSFNAYVGTELKLYEFTIETSRQLALEKRIKQQLNILKILFDYAWNEE